LAYADVFTASADYARRFEGPIGEFLLEVQTRLTQQMLARFPAAPCWTSAGGHGSSRCRWPTRAST
jgi:hypothetical protein